MIDRVQEFEQNVKERLRVIQKIPTPQKPMQVTTQPVVNAARHQPTNGERKVPPASAFLIGLCFGVIAARVAAAPTTISR